MAWVKLDDGFPDHPKVAQAGDLAAWLYVCGLTYSNRLLTDGFIPESVVPRLTGLKGPVSLAKRLVNAGLWERAEGGYRIHDYLEYQPSADKAAQEREANAARVAAWKRRSRGATNEEVTPLPDHYLPPPGNGGGNGRVMVPPYPVPVPVPVEDENLERGPTSWNGSAPSAAATTTSESLEKVERFAESLRGRAGWEPTAEQLHTLGDYAAEHAINLAAEAIAIGGWLDGPKGKGRECSARFVLDWLKREARAPNGSMVPTPSTNGAIPKLRGNSRAKHH